MNILVFAIIAAPATIALMGLMSYAIGRLRGE